MRAVAGLVDVEQRHDQTRGVRRCVRRGSSPGCIRRRSSAGRARPSARAAGCRARRRSCSSRSRSRRGPSCRTAAPSRRRASATLLVGTREVSSTTSEKVLRSWKSPRCLADPAAFAVAADGVADLLLEDPPGAAQLAQAVEVADDRHVRVGGVLRVVVAAGVAVCTARPRPSARARPCASPPWGCGPGRRRRRSDAPERSVAGTVRAKNESRRSGPGRREDLRKRAANSAWIWSCARRTVAVEATIFGLTAAPSSSRACRAPSIAVSYRPGHRSERTRDQVKLVLDDEIRRRQRLS